MNDPNRRDNTFSDQSDADPKDVDWIAFQYLAGELAAVDADRFEACLAEDQGAREALARAVELTQVVAVIEAGASRTRAVQPADSSTRLTPAAWLAAAALACLAVAVLANPAGWRLANPKAPQSARSHETPAVDELASIWVDTGEFLVTTSLVDAEEFEDGLSEEETLDWPSPDVDRLHAPSWMIAAMAASSNHQMQEPSR